MERGTAYMLFYEREGLSASDYLPKVDTTLLPDTKDLEDELEVDFKKHCSLMQSLANQFLQLCTHEVQHFIIDKRISNFSMQSLLKTRETQINVICQMITKQKNRQELYHCLECDCTHSLIAHQFDF